MSSKFEVNWEDDDGSFDKAFAGNDKAGVNDFSEMLNEEKEEESESFHMGNKVSGIICSIPEKGDDILVELGSKSSAVIARNEISNEEGQLLYKLGDKIEAYIISKNNGEIVLSHSLSQKVLGEEALDNAFSNKIPVKGKVIKENSGGFDVTIMGKNAFCPVSQIDTKFVTDKAKYLGKEYDFLITKRAGRDLVVSRRDFLKIGQKQTIAELADCVKSGKILDGTVEEIRDFGAMVDVMGVVGMVHVSQIGYSRVANVKDVLKVGDPVKVKVQSVEEGPKGVRISLSMKDASQDPWETISDKYAEGGSYKAKIIRLESFGAFAELEPGLEGLIHISEISWTKRILHPKDVLAVNDNVEVKILSINPLDKRISLSLKSKEEDPWINVPSKYTPGSSCKATVSALKSFGAIIDLEEGVTGMLPISTIKKAFGDQFKKKLSTIPEIEVVIAQVNEADRKILLTLPSLEEDESSDGDYREYLKQQEKSEKKPVEKKSIGNFGELLKEKLKS